jgi:hypothetical protein
MYKRAQQVQEPFTDLELFRQVLRHSEWSFYRSLKEARKDFWKRALLGAFLAGPFMGFWGIVGLMALSRSWLVPVVLAINAICCFAFPLGFHLYSTKLPRDSLRTTRSWKDYVSFLSYLLLGWIGFFGSVMWLLGIVSAFIWHHYSGWEIFFAGYIGAGIVFWRKRRIFLRAIARPDLWWRLFFRYSPGIAVLISALGNIILKILGRTISPTFSFMIVMTLMLSISLLLLGGALVACSLASLFYQRWQGVEELKL